MTREEKIFADGFWLGAAFIAHGQQAQIAALTASVDALQRRIEQFEVPERGTPDTSAASDTAQARADGAKAPSSKSSCLSAAGHSALL
jgi:hypothetical protein